MSSFMGFGKKQGRLLGSESLSSRSHNFGPPSSPLQKKTTEQTSGKNKSRRVSNAALANAALVLSSKNWKKYSRWGAASKINPKSLGPAFPLCRCAGIDVALAKADFFFAGAPTIENKIEQTFQTLRWRLLRWCLTLSKRVTPLKGVMDGGRVLAKFFESRRSPFGPNGTFVRYPQQQVR